MSMPVVHQCPDGHYRHMIYNIGPFIVVYPKQVMLSEVVQGWCPRCTSKSSNLNGEGGLSTLEFSSAELWDEYGIDDDIMPFTNDFPCADIHENLSLDLLHQIIKGSFKDHLVTWVCKYILKMHGKSCEKEILDDINKWLVCTCDGQHCHTKMIP
ncbi:hypothetical protein EI94DRAFT_1774118 [Lactarius quietus]|nr:hypothetical protein EI94DRAFT_1774118 [Lactarius quietus]